MQKRCWQISAKVIKKHYQNDQSSFKPLRIQVKMFTKSNVKRNQMKLSINGLTLLIHILLLCLILKSVNCMQSFLSNLKIRNVLLSLTMLLSLTCLVFTYSVVRISKQTLRIVSIQMLLKVQISGLHHLQKIIHYS